MAKELIEKLGGAKVIAPVLNVSRSAVANWSIDGRAIPWKHRHVIARLAAERAVALPADFWGEVA